MELRREAWCCHQVSPQLQAQASSEAERGAPPPAFRVWEQWQPCSQGQQGSLSLAWPGAVLPQRREEPVHRPAHPSLHIRMKFGEFLFSGQGGSGGWGWAGPGARRPLLPVRSSCRS